MGRRSDHTKGVVSVACETCGARFSPKFMYQVEATSLATHYYCSAACRIPELREDRGGRDSPLRCVVCDRSFTPLYAYQVVSLGKGPKRVCSEVCRGLLLGPRAERRRGWVERTRSSLDGARGPGVSEAAAPADLPGATASKDGRRGRSDSAAPNSVRGPARTARPERSAGVARSRTGLVARDSDPEGPGQRPEGAAQADVAGEVEVAAQVEVAAGAGVAGQAEVASEGTGTLGPRVIAVYNPKGGTGKTTSSVSIAAGLALRGRRTLLVDLDSQGCVSLYFEVRRPKGLFEVLFEECPICDAIFPLRRDLFVLMTDPFAPRMEGELLRAASASTLGRLLADSESSVRWGTPETALDPILALAGYDCVVFDCPPAEGMLSDLAVQASDAVVMPVSCDYLSLLSVKRAVRNLRTLAENMRPGRRGEVLLLPTFFDARDEACRLALQGLEAYLPGRVLPAVPASRHLREAPRHRRTIFEHAPRTHAARGFGEVAAMLLERWQEPAGSASKGRVEEEGAPAAWAVAR